VGALTVNLSQDQPMSKASYSPDGFWLVFQSRYDGGTRDLFIMTHSGVGRQRLTEDPWNNFDAVWRPDKLP
jgi:Tol biopolymer transport system component